MLSFDGDEMELPRFLFTTEDGVNEMMHFGDNGELIFERPSVRRAYFNAVIEWEVLSQLLTTSKQIYYEQTSNVKKFPVIAWKVPHSKNEYESAGIEYCSYV